MELKKAIKIVNNISEYAAYLYVPDSEGTEFVRHGKPTYFVGNDGRRAIKTVLRALRNSIARKKIEEFIKEELPNDKICATCDIYDVNGVEIKKKLQELLEGK